VDVLKREAALESELQKMKHTLERDEQKARLAERLARRKGCSVDGEGDDIQARVQAAAVNREKHLEVAKVMRTDFQERTILEVNQARKRSVMHKRLKNRLVVRVFAASSDSSSSVGDDGSESFAASSTGSDSFIDSDEASSEESEPESGVEVEAEELAVAETVDNSAGTDVVTAGVQEGCGKKVRKRKTGRRTTKKTSSKTKEKSVRKSNTSASPSQKAGVKSKSSKVSALRIMASNTMQRQMGERDVAFDAAPSFKPAVVSAVGVSIHRKNKKKARRDKRETLGTDNDDVADNVAAAVGTFSLSSAKPKRRASLRISVDNENYSECDVD
jgi:hypothetical protein